MLPSRLPYVKGLFPASGDQEAPTAHLGLTPLQTFCQAPVLEVLDGHHDADAEPADARPGLCTHCLDALAEYRHLTSTTKRTTLTWNEALTPGGRSTAQLVQSALAAREHLALIERRLYPVPEDQRADALLALLADVSSAQQQLDSLADEIVLALRDVCRPSPSWARIGQRLNVKDAAVRHRYSRGAAEHPGHLQLCPFGCGELRPASLPGDHDPWKYHDLDHEGLELAKAENDN
ncbi:hypothetical protein ACGF12_13855 [Kitasatospora sp. NPDC048296]|uniref:hypothetical protein n=1 Tax=Kitasatospora sp. NPDC048296 TaxID=3364048 RepID=UPI0037147556